MKNQSASILENKLIIILLVVLFSILLIAGGFVFYNYDTEFLKEDKENEIKAIAELKIEQIENWLAERFADAGVISKSAFLVEAVDDWLKNQADMKLGESIIEMMSLPKEEYNYLSIYLSTTEGKILLSTSQYLSHLDASTINYINQSVQRKKITFTGFYYCRTEETIHFDMVAPVIKDNKIIAVLVLRSDPYRYIYPLIQSWPTLSKTSETLLIKSQRDSVLFLNELRHKKNTALKLHLSINDDLPAANAILGKRGIFEGKDYRGVDVLTYLSPIAGTEWFMVAKIDTDEILSELRFRAIVIFIIVFGFMLILSLGVSALYHFRQKKNLKELLELQRDAAASETKYRRLHESMRDGFVYVNMEGVIINANEAYCNMVGYTEEELKNLTYVDLTPEKWHNFESSLVSEQILTRGFSEVYEKEYRKKDGTVFPVELRTLLIKNGADENEGMWTIVRDITERKQIEAELLRNESLLRETGKMAKVGGWELDTATMKQVWTDATYVIHDREQNEYNPNPTEEIRRFEPGSRELIEKAFEDAITLGKPYDLEVEMTTIKGNRKWVRAVCKPLLVNGKVVKLTGAVQDISERKLTEVVLQENEEMFRGTFEQAAVGIAHVSQKGEFIRLNQRFCDITGYNKKEMMALTFQEITHPDDLNADLEYVRQMTSGEIRTYSMEKRYIRKNKEIVWINLTASLIRGPAGEPKYFIAVVEDITARKQAEEELKNYRDHLEEIVTQRTEDVLETNKELEAFSYSVSHDLRAPLRAIAGFSAKLAEEYNLKLDDEGKRLISVITGNTKKMGQLIDDLLAFSRVSRTEINIKKVNMTKLFESAWDELMHLCPDRSINFKADNIPAIYADPTTIKQVIINLLSNAVKFTRSRNDAEVEVGHYSENNNDVIYIKDNGVGFNMKYSGKLFNVFQRLHSAKDYDGTGVGLAIVHRIIQRHGGKVWAEAELDVGASFYFSLPKKGAIK